METTVETNETKTTVTPIALADLGRGLYTEVVTVDPTVDSNTPPRPIDEATFDEKGNETGKIVYKAILSAPEDGATDFDGNPRPFTAQVEGVSKKDKKPWSKRLINFNVKVVEFADINADQTKLQGRSGKTFETDLDTFTKAKDGEKYLPLLDFAQKLGIIPVPPKNSDGTAPRVEINTESLLALVAQHIATGQATIGVTVKWVANWQEGENGKRGHHEYAYQRNFPKDSNNTPQPVANTRVKLVTFEKLA